MSKKIIIVITLISVLSLIYYSTHAQGCSDAGFCSINGLRPHSYQQEFVKKSHIKIGTNFGPGDHSIITLGNYFEYNHDISSQLGVNAKITSLSQRGNKLSTFGLSDIYLSGSYRYNEKLNFIFGSKIPFNSGNQLNANIALPMDYQSSLGTLDLIAGLGYAVNKMQFILAYQQPISQNKNGFLTENYPSTSKLREFQSTNKFIRSGDLLLRFSYPIATGQKLKLTPSLLPIYHLDNDRYTNGSGIENEIKGSQGLTLNGNLYIDYELNKTNFIQFSTGMPFLVRTARPDGLTRSFVLNIEYSFKF
ncbi:hypothetical protein V7S79_01525 [Aquirufa sp. ROCK-SH2]